MAALVLVGSMVHAVAASANTVDGVAFQDQAGTVWSGCDGVTANVAVYYSTTSTLVNGPCAAGTGAFSIVVPMTTVDGTVAVYLDGTGAAAGGVTYTRNAATSGTMTADVIRQRVTIMSDTATNTTNAHVDLRDATADADIPASVTAGALTTTAANIEVYVPATETFAPGGSVTVPAMDVGGTYVAAAGVNDTFTGGSTNASCTSATTSQQPLCVRAGGIYTTSPTNTVQFTTGATILVPGLTYTNVSLLPTSGTPTYRLGDVAGDTFRIEGTLTIGNGTHAMTADMGQYSPTINAIGDGAAGGNITISASATLSGGTGYVTVAGSVTGAGTFNSPYAGLRFRPTYDAAPRIVGSTAGAQDWNLGSLLLYNDHATPQVVRTAAGGTGSIILRSRLEACEFGNVNGFTLDANTNDRRIQVDGDVIVARSCTFSASSSERLVVSRTFTFQNPGAFTHNSGTVELADVGMLTRFDQSAGSTLSLHDLRVTDAGKTVMFDNSETLQVQGTLTVDGGSCGTRIGLGSTTLGDAAAIQVWAWAVTHADVGDLTAVVAGGSVAGVTTNSVDAGNNTSFTFNTPCATSAGAVAGFARDPNTGTTWAACDGVTPNVLVSLNAGRPQPTPCDATTGAFSLTAPIPGASQLLAVYLDGGSGITYVRTPTPAAAVTGVEVGPMNATILDMSAGPDLTDDDVARYSKMFDARIPVTANYEWAVTGQDVVLDAGVELRVESGTTFAPARSTTVTSLDVRGSFIQVGLTYLIFQGSGTGGCDGGPNVQRPLCVSPGGSTTLNGIGVVHFTGTAETDIEGDSYGEIYLIPAAATTPTFHLGAGSSNIVQGRRLDVGPSNAAVASTSKYAAEIRTVEVFGGGAINVGAGSSLVGNSTNPVNVQGSFTGAGTVTLPSTPLQMRSRLTSATSFGSTAGASDWSFGSIEVSNSLGTASTLRSAAGGTGTILTGNLTVGRTGDAAASTLDLNTNDRLVDIDDSLSILSVGTLQASSSQPLRVANDISNSGTFSANGGTVVVDDAAQQSSVTHAAGITFANLSVTTPSEVLLLDHDSTTTVGGALTVDGGACGTRITMRSVTDGNDAPLNVTGSATVSFVDVRDSTAVTPRSATRAVNLGGNSGWSLTTDECATISVSLTSAPTVDLGTGIPGESDESSVTVDITTNNATGYQVSATDEHDTWGADCACGGTVADWTGTSATPSVWALGAEGVGIGVRDATGGRLAKWGTGGGPYPLTDYANNRYAGMDLGSSTLLHSTTSATPGTYSLEAIYRINTAPTTPPGSYDSTVTISVVTNP